MNEIDIIEIDRKIHQNFVIEQEKLKDYEVTLEKLKTTFNNIKNSPHIKIKLEKDINRIKNKIEKILSKEQLLFYIYETSFLIEEYKRILKIPQKVNFMGKVSKKNKQKEELIEKFINVATKYIAINQKSDKQKIKCTECSNTKNFEIEDDTIYICCECYSRQYIIKNNSSFKDIDRVNISNKYNYDRKIHFRDCIKQYQGKQNANIPPDIYEKLEEQFLNHHLLVGDKNTCRKERFKNITKKHILMFLKQLNFSKHYENAHLIHYNITEIKPDDISYLEEQLLIDFDILTELYDKKFKNINRKNFINTQYVLYQLLYHHKHKCNKEDFVILKTIDRNCFHDDICKKLFEELGWNHIPMY